MNSDRLWVIAAVAVMVVIAIGGWFVGVSPIVAQGAAADSQTASINQANSANQAKVALLKKQFAHIAKFQNKLDKLRLSIPEQTQASAFLAEVNALCQKDSVTLASLTIASSTIYQAPTTKTTSADSSTTSTATPTPTPTPSTPTATPGSTTGASAGQLVQIPVQITVGGSISQVVDFMGDVQLAARLYLAAGSGLSYSPTDGTYQGSLTGFLFTLQGTSDQPNATTPTDTSTATPTPTAIPTPTGTATTAPTIAPKSTVAPKPKSTPTPGATPTQAP
ncbi:MAG TPA: hypothetical protein VH084_12720 [Mycobacterium sp.]|jgi:Tfp pilus assembly protein PilO|nr:hypothetical protein [Mycobacterium sp.]